MPANVRFPPIATVVVLLDKIAMRGGVILKELSRRVPVGVSIVLGAALLAYWAGAALWLPRGLAIGSGSLALVLIATRDRRRWIETETESGDRAWFANELAGSGSPSGTSPLAFFAMVTIALTGFEGAYALPGWAALGLVAAWATANAHYPSGESTDGQNASSH
jgi:hypothetical protein